MLSAKHHFEVPEDALNMCIQITRSWNNSLYPINLFKEMLAVPLICIQSCPLAKSRKKAPFLSAIRDGLLAGSFCFF